MKETLSSSESLSARSCILGRIHGDISLNIPQKVHHIVMDVTLSIITLFKHDFIVLYVEEGSFIPLVLIYTGFVKYLR